MRMAAKLAPPEIPIADLVPSQWEESPDTSHQVVLEFLVILNRLRWKKQRDRDCCLLGHRSQTHKIVSIAIIEGKRDTRDVHLARTQKFDAFGYAHNSIMSLSEAHLVPENFCRYAHAVDPIGNQ